MLRRARTTALLAVAALAAAASAAPAAPDWVKLAPLETVEVVTSDADGEARTTTVWLAVLDGEGYVRTGRTRWGANAERERALGLLAGGERYELRVELVEDDVLRARVAEAFRAKYGWQDAALSWVRGGRPRIMRLLPRE